MSTYMQGNTVRLRRTFVDFDGNAYDPTNATLKIFDAQRNLIETISVDTSHKVGTGVYQVDVTLPSGYDMVVYEFSGIDPRGNPDLARRAIPTPWAFQ